MKIVSISDTHEKHLNVNLPEGDVLIHAGDITKNGSIPAIARFAEWMRQQDFKHKIVISGNHDFCFQNENYNIATSLLREAGITYLQDSETVIDGVKFWGAPWQPWYHSWAFNLPRGKDIAEKWSFIPDDTNVLITHGPPYKILDRVLVQGINPSFDVGCEDLLNRINELKSLKAHIFGHIHNGYGQLNVGGVKFVNAAICTEEYQATNSPIIIEV